MRVLPEPNRIIYTSNCPLCRKRISINNCIPCKSFDSLIDSQLSSEQLPQYEIRKQKVDEWKQSRQLKNTKVGMKIDALDTEGIWCSAVIKLKIDNGEKNPFLYVHYLGWSSSYNELISEGSHRVAPAGFYTSKNIPRYRMENFNENLNAEGLENL